MKKKRLQAYADQMRAALDVIAESFPNARRETFAEFAQDLTTEHANERRALATSRAACDAAHGRLPVSICAECSRPIASGMMVIDVDGNPLHTACQKETTIKDENER